MLPARALSCAMCSAQRFQASRAYAAGTPKPETLPVAWSNVKGILFDVDGTLTDSDDLHFRAFVDLQKQPEWEFNGTMPHYSTPLQTSPNAAVQPDNGTSSPFREQIFSIRCTLHVTSHPFSHQVLAASSFVSRTFVCLQLYASSRSPCPTSHCMSQP